MKRQIPGISQFLDESKHTYQQALSGYEARNFAAAAEFAAASASLSRVVEIIMARTLRSDTSFPSLVPPPPENFFNFTDSGHVEENLAEAESVLAARCRVGMVVDVSGSSTPLPVDKSRMAQVFDNIIQNAIEAMSERGGTLSVVLTSHNLFPDNGSGVRVEFRDTGKGMNAAMMSHAFDPFFTTKSSGTGLGLSICHELVRAHGGDIQIASEEGLGTTVRVSLPANPPIT